MSQPRHTTDLKRPVLSVVVRRFPQRLSAMIEDAIATIQRASPDRAQYAAQLDAMIGNLATHSAFGDIMTFLPLTTRVITRFR